MTAAASPVVKLPLGSHPRWEEGEDETSLIEEDSDPQCERVETIALKGVQESLVLLHTLRQSRQRWINNPPLTKFSVRARGKTTIDIPQPPHSLIFLGRCDVEIGPHVFLDTKVMEVQWDNMYQPSTSTSTIPSTLPLRTDVIIELRENSTERFLLPLDGASIERISDGGRTFILLSLLLDIPQTELMPADALKTCAKQPVNFKLFQGTTSIWEGLERRINATPPVRRSQLKEEFEGVMANKPQRVFPPHRLPPGRLFSEVEESVLDKIRPASIQLKALRIGPPTSSGLLPKRRPQATMTKEKILQKSASVPVGGPVTSESASTKKYERRTKVTCTVCGKAIARKTDDVTKEGYKPMCRQCAFEARKAARASAKAYAASVAASKGPTQGLQVDVVIPRSAHPPPSIHPYGYYTTYLPPQQQPPYAATYASAAYRGIPATSSASPSGSTTATTTSLPAYASVNTASGSRPPTYPYTGTLSSYPYFASATASTYSARPYSIQGYYNAQSAREWARSTFVTTPGVHSPELPKAPPPTDRTPATSTPTPTPSKTPAIDPAIEKQNAQASGSR